MPLVNHVFIGAIIDKTCPTGVSSELRVYGANKSSDVKTWQAYSVSPSNAGSRMQLVGRVCGVEASQALDAAVGVSVDWQRAMSNPLERVARMAATPLMGRPCNNAANEIIEATAGLLGR